MRVLHVDDEPDIRNVVQLALGLDPDFEVRSCGSGRDCLETAISWSPDLVLIDVMMPVMDGPTTLSEMRKRSETANIPVVFMTARTQPHELKHFVALGAEGVIEKPFDPMTLAAAVRQFSSATNVDLAVARAGFLKKTKATVRILLGFRPALLDPNIDATTVGQIQVIARALADEAGKLGLGEIRAAARRLEDATSDREGEDLSDAETALRSLLELVGVEC